MKSITETLLEKHIETLNNKAKQVLGDMEYYHSMFTLNKKEHDALASETTETALALMKLRHGQSNTK